MSDQLARLGIELYVRTQSRGHDLSDQEMDQLVDDAMFELDDLISATLNERPEEE